MNPTTRPENDPLHPAPPPIRASEGCPLPATLPRSPCSQEPGRGSPDAERPPDGRPAWVPQQLVHDQPDAFANINTLEELNELEP